MQMFHELAVTENSYVPTKHVPRDGKDFVPIIFKYSVLGTGSHAKFLKELASNSRVVCGWFVRILAPFYKMVLSCIKQHWQTDTWVEGKLSFSRRQFYKGRRTIENHHFETSIETADSSMVVTVRTGHYTVSKFLITDHLLITKGTK